MNLDSWMKLLRRVRGRRLATHHASFRPTLESLEELILPSGITFSPTYVVDHPAFASQANSAAISGITPSQIRQAYDFNQISFNNGTVVGNGSGQTIALVDAYDDPSIAADLAVFDSEFGLQAPPSFTKVGINSSGQASTTTFPTANSGWAGEIELDVEWAHAIAPGANILLVEANSSSDTDLLNAVNYARQQPGVVAVSMSWGGSEFSGEASEDSYFTSPSASHGVAFFGSAGDDGSPELWPAISTHVIGVGGTTLNVNAAGDYLSESAWSDSGGSLSKYLPQPSYQQGLQIYDASANGMRAGPDVSYDANPNTGFAVYGTYGFGGWAQVGGTSDAAPQWAALTAIVDQGLALAGKGSLDGYTQLLPDLYKLPSTDFHDVTSGSNGNPAGAGFDLVTGLGTPIANLIVSDLVGESTGGGTGTSQPPSITTDATASIASSKTANLGVLAKDVTGDLPPVYTWSLSSGPAAVTLSVNGTASADNTTATFSKVGAYTFLVTVTDPSDGLTASSSVTYTVAQALSTVVSPSSVTVAPAGKQQFTATTMDQFGNVVATSGFTWSLSPSSAGTISSAGLFTAASTASGSVTVKASYTLNGNTASGTASVTIGSSKAPTIVTAATATYVSSKTANLAVLAQDSPGDLPPIYTWKVTSGPATVLFSINGPATAYKTTATFSKAGTYTFQVTATDPSNGLTATSSVTYTVVQVLSLVVAPGTVTVAPGGKQQFTGTVTDQFGTVVASSGFAWSLSSSSAGTISSAGLFTAASNAGGSGTVKASYTLGTTTVSGTAAVSIQSNNVLFQDNFAEGAGNWTVTSGNDYYLANVNGGNRLLVNDNGSSISRAVAGQSSWTNYSYQATLNISSVTTGSASLIARVQDNTHLYFFGYDVPLGAWMIALRNGSTVTILATSAPFALSYGTDYTVDADLYGSSLSLYVDGVLEVSTTDSTYASGKIGFTATNGVAELGNVLVTQLTAPAKSTTQTTQPPSTPPTGSGSSGGETAPGWLISDYGLASFLAMPDVQRWLLGLSWMGELRKGVIVWPRRGV